MSMKSAGHIPNLPHLVVPTTSMLPWNLKSSDPLRLVHSQMKLGENTHTSPPDCAVSLFKSDYLHCQVVYHMQNSGIAVGQWQFSPV